MVRFGARFWRLALLAFAAILTAPAVSAQPLDSVRVGVIPLSSSLPYFVARDLGYFRDVHIEPETVSLLSGPANLAALTANQIEVAAVLVTLEGFNANLQRPGIATYIAMHGQNPASRMEQFVARSDLGVKTLAGLKGLKLMSAPGPANLNTAKGVLAKIGLKESDYTIDQLDMGQHVNAMRSGTFDGGYTLEPSATVMERMGYAKRIEAGVIAKYILGDEKADAFAAGCALSSDFIARRPDVARRFAAAWARAVDYINKQPDAARKHLAKNTLTPDHVVDHVPILKYVMVRDFTPEQLGWLQKFADFGVEIGVLAQKVDVKKYIKAF